MIRENKLDLFFQFRTGKHLQIECTIVGVLPVDEYSVSLYDGYIQCRWIQNLKYTDIVYLMYNPEDASSILQK